ncbi:hypothetical protein LTS18_001204 [Coniosporium uncinatum]|uniref:Uncharacterized protein n=1 Tax=Coniosporium uncinatum TaxID=93489 RepID=A0ACC3DUR9_9PEZI|nr:hypothetical protein LTS18_001204 [Coniosporium uncinatum]
MSTSAIGRAAKPSSSSPFEIVPENRLDFENYKGRSDFRDEHGGDGELYYGAASGSRPSTPATFIGADRDRGRSSSRGSSVERGKDMGVGVTYPAGYHQTPSAPQGGREWSPSPAPSRVQSLTRMDSVDAVGETGLLGGAAPMGRGGMVPSPYGVETPGSEGETSYEYFRGRQPGHGLGRL